jgi:CheY-like chemotaxis protein
LHRGPGVKLDEPDLIGLRILVVDDDLDLRESLTMLLELYGASVTAVGSAREAFQIVSRAAPDVVLSDLCMPGEDGYELIRKIRALPSDRGAHVPAAAITARTGAEDRRRALAEGFQVYVPKPVSGEDLVAVVARLGGRTPSDQVGIPL